MNYCYDHKELSKSILLLEKTDDKQWEAIELIKEKIAKTKVDIALIMGAIGAIQFILTLIFIK